MNRDDILYRIGDNGLTLEEKAILKRCSYNSRTYKLPLRLNEVKCLKEELTYSEGYELEYEYIFSFYDNGVIIRSLNGKLPDNNQELYELIYKAIKSFYYFNYEDEDLSCKEIKQLYFVLRFFNRIRSISAEESENEGRVLSAKDILLMKLFVKYFMLNQLSDLLGPNNHFQNYYLPMLTELPVKYGNIVHELMKETNELPFVKTLIQFLVTDEYLKITEDDIDIILDNFEKYYNEFYSNILKSSKLMVIVTPNHNINYNGIYKLYPDRIIMLNSTTCTENKAFDIRYLTGEYNNDESVLRVEQLLENEIENNNV